MCLFAPRGYYHVATQCPGEGFRMLASAHERKKHPKKICIKNFGGTLAGGSRRGLRRPNSLCRCWFSQQNTVHKEFRGGGSKGVLGVGSKVQFWGPISLCLCAFLGLDLRRTFYHKNIPPKQLSGHVTHYMTRNEI